MGFIDKALTAFKKRKTDAEREEFIDALASAIASKTLGTPMSDEERREIEERNRLAEEGRAIRRERLAALDVNVEAFTEGKAVRDALDMLRAFAPPALGIGVSERPTRAEIDFQNLTGTGRVPKNVATGQAVFDSPENSERSIVVNLKYLSDGSPNMADLHIWSGGFGLHIDVRRGGGSYRIAKVSRTDIARDLYDLLYQGDGDPSEIIVRELQRMT